VIRVRVIASSAVVRAGIESVLREDSRFMLAPATAVANRRADAQADVTLIEGAGPPTWPLAARNGAEEAAAVVLLCDPLGRAGLRRALAAGVRAVLPRHAHPAEILAALEAVAAGLIVLTSEDLDALLPASPEMAHDDAIPGEPLSTRETEILGMLAEGMANKEIAARLKISEHTVKFHVSSILGKLGVTSRGEAVARGMREGLIVI
jgi:DNA-binding NarL/FixJ family response regulator